MDVFSWLLPTLSRLVPVPVAVLLTEMVRMLWIYACLMPLETLARAEQGQPRRHIVFNLMYVPIYAVATTLLMATVIGGLAKLVREGVGGPVLALPVPVTPLGQLAAGLLYLLVFDFFYYWFHRLQHWSQVLWAQHKLHHSDVSLNITTTYRHHWLEEPLRVFFVAIPMGLVCDVKPLQAGAMAFVVNLWSTFIHMNTRLDLAWLTPVLCGPQAHRIHHSARLEHQNRNFAAYFPVWDILFGTFWRPRASEFPATGLHSGETVDGLIRAQLGPFRDWLGLLRSSGRAPDADRALPPPSASSKGRGVGGRSAPSASGPAGSVARSRRQALKRR